MKKTVILLVLFIVLITIVIVFMNIKNDAKLSDERLSIQADYHEAISVQMLNISGKEYIALNDIAYCLETEFFEDKGTLYIETNESKKDSSVLSPVEAQKIARIILMDSVDEVFLDNANINIKYFEGSQHYNSYYCVKYYGTKGFCGFDEREAAVYIYANTGEVRDVHCFVGSNSYGGEVK